MSTQMIIGMVKQVIDFWDNFQVICYIVIHVLLFKINYANLLGKPQRQEKGHKSLIYSYLKLVVEIWIGVSLITRMELWYSLMNFLIDKLEKYEILDVGLLLLENGAIGYSIIMMAIHNIWHKIKYEGKTKKDLLVKIMRFLLTGQKNSKEKDEKLVQLAQKIDSFFSFDAYDKSSDGEKLFLREEYVQHRGLYRVLSISSLFLLFITNWLVGNVEWSVADEYVIISTVTAWVLYCVELYSYYNGYTQREYMEQAVCEERDSEKYDTLYSKSVLIQDIDDRKVIAEKLRELNRNSDGRLRCFGKALSNAFSEEYYHMDFISAGIRLINYQSVYFATPFYRDIEKYIFPFLNLELLENKKVLVISGIKDSKNELRQWFEEGLERRYGHLDFWEIQKIQDGTKEADIGIVSLEQINEVVIGNEITGFWENISTVILLEPSYFLTYHPLFISQILSKFRTYQEKVTYIVCDVNTNGMVDLLSDMLKVSFVYVNATMSSKEGVHSIINVDQDVLQGAFSVVRQCFATELQMAADIKKTMQESIHWYGNDILPIWDVSQAAGQYYQLLAGQTKSSFQMSILYEIFDFQEDGSKALQEKSAINFVEDSLFNAFELLRQFDTRGKKYFHTVIFSPNYMLLEYMIEREQKMISDAQYIVQQMPKFQFSLRNLCIDLGYRMTKGSISSEELYKLLKYYSFENIDIQEMLNQINEYYSQVFEIDKMKITESRIKEEEYGKGNKEYAVLEPKGISDFGDWYRENIATALYYNEVANEDRQYLNALAGGHVYQFYLPNQYFVLEGKYYKIKAIENHSGKRSIKLQRAANSLKNRRYYRQIRQYMLTNVASIRQVMNIGNICLQWGIADINVSTPAYFDSKSFNDLDVNNIVKISDIPIRKYKKKTYLQVMVMGGNVYTYAVLLKEILFSMFPHCWQLLSIAMQSKKQLEGRIDNLLITAESKMEPIDNQFNNSFYIIEDSPMDIGLLETIYNEFGNLLELIGEYAAWGRKSQKLEKFWGADFLQYTEVFELSDI